MTLAIESSLPGDRLSTEKMPAHWLLARMGKRVLRPGGLELTRQMLAALDVQGADEVVEFAPGLGVTTQLTLKRQPAHFTAIERDQDAAERVQAYLSGAHQRCIVGRAEETGLPDQSASVVYGEAMLTMQAQQRKSRIVQEAFRLLQPNGRYAIHELCLTPNNLDEEIKDEIQESLSRCLRVNARPLTVSEWNDLLESAGLCVQAKIHAPMKLLEPRRLVRDEGLFGAARFLFNVVRTREARQRVLQMRKVFHKYRDHIAAIALVGQKPK